MFKELTVFRIYLLSLFLLLSSNAVHAHLSGITDTEVKLTQKGLRLIYTTPTESLSDLGGISESNRNAVAKAVLEGFDISNSGEVCVSTKTSTRSLETIDSEQFEFLIDCGRNLNSLSLTYNLFFENNSAHENFARISLLNRSTSVTFSRDHRNHIIPVKEYIQAWSRKNEAFEQQKPTVQSSRHYFPVGVEHILLGFDHLLFLFALLLIPLKIRQLLALVTCFTLAHSITLAVSVLGVMTLPVVFVETAIGFSIVYVAIESIVFLRKNTATQISLSSWRKRLLATFVFGLIHGFGFSYILKTMGLGDSIFGALLFFNFGVEFGQLLAIACVYPLFLFLFRQLPNRNWAQVLATLIGITGLFWFVERVASIL